VPYKLFLFANTCDQVENDFLWHYLVYMFLLIAFFACFFAKLWHTHSFDITNINMHNIYLLFRRTISIFFLIKLETYDQKIGKFPKSWVLLQFEGDFFLFFNLMIMKLYSNYRFFFICITILLLFFQTLFLVCLCKKIVYMYFLLLFFQTVFLIFGMSLEEKNIFI
jgi:hypothetical protein